VSEATHLEKMLAEKANTGRSLIQVDPQDIARLLGVLASQREARERAEASVRVREAAYEELARAQEMTAEGVRNTRARAERAEADNAARARIGALMSNVLFNMKQEAGEGRGLTEHTRETMASLQHQWDTLGDHPGRRAAGGVARAAEGAGGATAIPRNGRGVGVHAYRSARRCTRAEDAYHPRPHPRAHHGSLPRARGRARRRRTEGDGVRRLLCRIFGHTWLWFRYGDPELCPSGVEPWTCSVCGHRKGSA
jgi:hypothetical protein